MNLLEKEMAKRIIALGYDGLGVVVGFYSGLRERWYELRDQEFIRERNIDVTITNTMAAEWLRKKHGLLVYVTYSLHQRLYYTNIHDMTNGYKYCGCLPPEASKDYDTALGNAVLKAIQIIEDRQQ